MLILDLIFIFFYFCLSYDIIPILNFEKKFIVYSAEKNFSIFSYFHPGSPNSTYYYTHTIRKSYFGYYGMHHYLYLYDNLSQIEQNETTGEFINYNSKIVLAGKDGYANIKEVYSSNKTYYFVIQNDEKAEKELYVTVTVYSTQTLTDISNMVQGHLSKLSSFDPLLYKFQVPSEHKKYIVFGYKGIEGSIKANFTIFENANTIVYHNSTSYIENYFQLKNNCSYIIHLFLEKSNKYGHDVYFYLVQSEFTKYLPVEINTDYFENYPIFKDLYLLLNMSTIKKGNKVKIEYFKLMVENLFEIYSYNTEDANIVENTKGKKEKSVGGKSQNNICQNFIHKYSNDIKFNILKVKYPEDSWYNYYVDIKYGKQEKYISNEIYLSCGIGLALSIPNILLKIIRCFRDKKASNQCSFVMDIILHLAYGNIVSKFIYLGGKSFFYFRDSIFMFR